MKSKLMDWESGTTIIGEKTKAVSLPSYIVLLEKMARRGV